MQPYPLQDLYFMFTRCALFLFDSGVLTCIDYHSFEASTVSLPSTCGKPGSCAFPRSPLRQTKCPGCSSFSLDHAYLAHAQLTAVGHRVWLNQSSMRPPRHLASWKSGLVLRLPQTHGAYNMTGHRACKNRRYIPRQLLLPTLTASAKCITRYS